MDRQAAGRASPRSAEYLRRFHSDDCFEGAPVKVTSLAGVAKLAQSTVTPSESGHGGEDSLSSASDTDANSTQSEVPDERRAKCNPQIYSDKNLRRWASTFDLRRAVPAARPRLIEISRLPQLARRASMASLLPIQQPSVQDDYLDDTIPDSSPKVYPDVTPKDASTLIPGASDPLLSHSSTHVSGERAVHELSMSVGDVFEVRLCTKTPTRLEIKQL